MSDIVIRAEGLGKRYRIGEREPYLGLRHVLNRALTAPVRMLRLHKPQSPNGDATHIWALKDVSFEVRQGEVVGIIGRNGAGKTTLLKILAQVTMPTEGHARLTGRVGSLLEVGTGFHYELTGRENVYLSGAILGMRKKEIERKFDEIVAFAEVEKFIDTPLKYYSTGMQMRLAFAVAAHLEPEILLVDEVLAVGDIAFQKKCFGKIGEVSRGGRTILLVSHNLNAVSSLCRSVMVLNNGRVQHFSDNVPKGLRLYSTPEGSDHKADLSHHPGRVPGAAVVFQEISIKDERSGPSRCAPPGANLAIRLRLKPPARVTNPKIGLAATNFRGERVFAVGTYIGGNAIPILEGLSTISVRFVLPPLVPGEYTLDIGLYSSTGDMIDEVYGAASLEVLKDEYLSMVDNHSPEMGHIMVRSEWSCIQDTHATSDDLKAEIP